MAFFKEIMHSIYFGLLVAFFIEAIIVEGPYKNNLNYYEESVQRRNFDNGNDMISNFKLQNAFNNDYANE